MKKSLKVSFLIFCQRPKTCNFIKKKVWHRCSPGNFAKFLRTHIFIEHFWWLLLNKILNYCHSLKNSAKILNTTTTSSKVVYNHVDGVALNFNEKVSESLFSEKVSNNSSLMVRIKKDKNRARKAQLKDYIKDLTLNAIEMLIVQNQ